MEFIGMASPDLIRVRLDVPATVNGNEFVRT